MSYFAQTQSNAYLPEGLSCGLRYFRACAINSIPGGAFDQEYW
jgi:hypothetical protein